MRAALGAAREAFDAAIELVPGEWTYKCMGAKVARKIGAPPAEVLARLKATRDAAPGNLEAFYQMHCSRVKLLLRVRAALFAPRARAAAKGGRARRRARARGRARAESPKDPKDPKDPNASSRDGVLSDPRALADARATLASALEHCHDPAALARRAGGAPDLVSLVANASADVPADRARLTRLWEAAWEDACAAVRACARMCPGYHKAHYRAAWVALKHPSISTRSAQNENEPIVLTEEEALPSKATESPETPALDVPDAARAAPPSPPPSSLSLERLAVREARAALQPLFKLPAAQSKASRLGKAADVANAAPPKFAPHMAEIDDGALTTRSGGGARGVGSFRLLAVGINESGRKFVAAARRATRLFLALCFAAGDLEGLRVLVASASAHFRDAARLRGAGEPADLAALGLAYATRATAAALTDPETDLETKEEALALAYWLWVEHGIGNGGPDGWGVAIAEARGEARLESAFSEQFEEAFARADVSEEASAEAAALADAPPVLIGGPFAEALAASAAADVSAPAFAAHAAAHVEAAKVRGDVQTLLALYQDAGRRAAETQRRLKRARHARTSAAVLEAAAASARAHRDALRGALLASLEAIVLASDATDVGDPVTESDVRARFGAGAAARALHRERAEAAAAASRVRGGGEGGGVRRRGGGDRRSVAGSGAERRRPHGRGPGPDAGRGRDGDPGDRRRGADAARRAVRRGCRSRGGGGAR